VRRNGTVSRPGGSCGKLLLQRTEQARHLALPGQIQPCRRSFPADHDACAPAAQGAEHVFIGDVVSDHHRTGILHLFHQPKGGLPFVPGDVG